MTQTLTELEQLQAAGYVLGDLEPEELRQFEVQLSQSSALQAEVKALQASLRVLPLAQPLVTPPPALRDRVLADNLASDIAPELIPGTIPQPKPAQLPRPSGLNWSKLIALVTSLAAAVIGFDNFRLRQDLRLARQPQPAQPNSEAAAVGNLMQRPNSRLVALRGTNTNAAGTLMFTPGKWQEVVVSLGNLPPLPPDQVYRMWLTLKNGQVLPCGEFKTTPEGTVFIRINPPKTPPTGVKATGVFVTVDAANAPLTPTGQQVMTGSI
jgi:anti-sigma-K factor RskA